MRVVLVTNLHAPSDATATGGMELAASEALQALAAQLSGSHELAVVAHPDTVVPPEVELIPLGLPECPEEYRREGDGPRKWLTLATEEALYGFGVQYVCTADIVHTLATDAVGSAELARKLGAQLVRTLHLMPWFPGYAVTANRPDWCIYVSEYQRASDRWRQGAASSVIRDFVPVACLPAVQRASWAVTVGRVEPRKGHFEAAAVAESLGCDLVIVGQILDAAYAEAIRNHFGRRVRFMGPLDRQTTLATIASASTLIWTPRVQEPCGRVVIEALRLGTSVLGCQTGALHDIERMHARATRRVTVETTTGSLELVHAVPGDAILWPDSGRDFAAAHLALYERVRANARGGERRLSSSSRTRLAHAQPARPVLGRQLDGILDVVVPVSGRPEAIATVFSLLAIGPLVKRVIVVDGSQDGHEGVTLVDLASNDRRLICLHRPVSPFSKAACLNAGLEAAEAPLVLMSDADIIWYANTVRAMVEAVGIGRVDEAICSVADVEETMPTSPALGRGGYEFVVETPGERTRVVIRRRKANPMVRPGPGLVMATRATWRRLGGYADDFAGWGWEDQDLLIRAELAGISHLRVGRVLHLSHGDECRNADLGSVDPTRTRDANIMISLRRIRAGRLAGALAERNRNVESACTPVEVLFEDGIERDLVGFQHRLDLSLTQSVIGSASTHKP